MALVLVWLVFSAYALHKRMARIERELRAWRSSTPPSRAEIRTESGRRLMCRIEQLGDGRWTVVPPIGYRSHPADVLSIATYPGMGSLLVSLSSVRTPHQHSA